MVSSRQICRWPGVTNGEEVAGVRDELDGLGCFLGVLIDTEESQKGGREGEGEGTG